MNGGRCVNVWTWVTQACSQVWVSVLLRPPLSSKSIASCRSPFCGFTVLTNAVATETALAARLGDADGVTYQYAPRTKPTDFAPAQFVAKFVSTPVVPPCPARMMAKLMPAFLTLVQLMAPW